MGAVVLALAALNWAISGLGGGSSAGGGSDRSVGFSQIREAGQTMQQVLRSIEPQHWSAVLPSGDEDGVGAPVARRGGGGAYASENSEINGMAYENAKGEQCRDQQHCKPEALGHIMCGWQEITELECRSIGCCWDSASPVYKCFPVAYNFGYEHNRLMQSFLTLKVGTSASTRSGPRAAMAAANPNKVVVAPAQNHECAAPHPAGLVNCGFEGINERVCEEAGCCWTPNAIGGWCTMPASEYGSSQTALCADPSAEHGYTLQQCGPSGTEGWGEKECTRRGCCWRSDGSAGPSCYLPKLKPVVAPQESLAVCPNTSAHNANCGYDGIDGFNCKRMGCCWDAVGRRCAFPGEKLTAQWSSLVMLGRPLVGAQPLISVVMPCYKQEAYIKDAIESVLRQTYRNWELLVVDDGSPGGTCRARALKIFASEAESLAERRADAFVIPNSGLSAVRNWAIREKSRGEFIMPLDADDYLSPEFMLNAVAAMNEYPEAELLYADQVYYGLPSSGQPWYLVPRLTLEYAAMRGPLPVMTMYSRAAFDRIGGYAVDMIYGNEDYNFWLAMLQARTRTLKVRGISGWYRQKQSSMRTVGGYTKLAIPMTVAHNLWLYAGHGQAEGVASSVGQIFCLMEGADWAARLQQAVDTQPWSCPGWLWLALYKLRTGCIENARALIKGGLEHCQHGPPGGPREEEDRLRIHAQLLQLEQVQRLLSSGGEERLDPLVKARVACTESGDLDSKECGRCVARFAGAIATTVQLCDQLGDVHHTRRIAPVANDSSRAYQPSHNVPISTRVSKSVEEALSLPAPKLGIPYSVHFVYGLRDEGPPPFGLVEYLAMRSAKEVHASKVYLHCVHAPQASYWWNKAREFVTVVRHPAELEYADRCTAHHAHRADTLRLSVLQKYGGIYLDMDVLSIRPFPASIREHAEFVMAWQDSHVDDTVRSGKEHYGLCNAGMLSVPNARFVRLWQKSYEHFRTNGRDRWWDEHSVILPANLTDEHPELVREHLITPLPAKHMWIPLWDRIETAVLDTPPPSAHAEPMSAFPDMYTLHLWRSSDASKYSARLSGLATSTDWWETSELGLLAQRYLQKAVVTGDDSMGAETSLYMPKPLSLALASASTHAVAHDAPAPRLASGEVQYS